ncbi:HAMP domain-containing sensor histidine kinase, partial [Staphylococcus aureus]|nr:HAMP domain-containing sensor histidine kinase [Staphylococcus aureus]
IPENRSRLFWLSVLALFTAAASAALRAAVASSLKAQWIDPIAPVEAGELIGSALGSAFLGFAATLFVASALLDRIGALIGNLRQVSSDIAHDLRTPLTRLRAEAERAAGEWDGSEIARARLHKVVAQADEVLEIFAALLRISEIEAGGGRRGFGPLDLSTLVEEMSESYEPALRDGGRQLRWTVVPGVTITGDRQLLAQAIVNLIENAATHTPPGTMVEVML